MTLALRTPWLARLIVLVLALALVSVFALDQVQHLGLVQFLLHLPAWGNPCC